jgi:Chaperone of endosialidase
MSVSQNYQQSTPITKSPFGELPFSIAGGIRSGFAGPLGRGFGFGGGKKSPYGKGEGPLGTFIEQARPMLANYMPGQVDVSNQIMKGANSAYGGYQSAVDNFMKQLPGFQQTAASATGGGQEAMNLARRYSEDAFSALPGRASYQEASRRALAPAREAAAARGMLEGGQAQAGEQGILSDLAFQALQADQANQQAAIAQLGGAASNVGQLGANEAQIAGMGPAARGGLAQLYPQVADVLKTASGMPMDAMTNALNFLQSTQNPNFSLLKMVLPTVANKSMGGGGSVGISDPRLKEDVTTDVPGLDALLAVPPVAFAYVFDPDHRHYGVMADALAKVAPLAVGEMAGYLVVDYAALVPVLIQAIRDLSARLAAVEAKGDADVA